MKKIPTSFKDALTTIKETPKKSIAKTATRFVVRRSVGGIMVTLVHNYCPTETKAQKAQLYIGAWAIGNVVADSAANWAAEAVGDLIDALEEFYENGEDPSNLDEKSNHHIHPSE